MPGSVANAVPATVMPFTLFKLFRASREYPLIGNEYANGESQRALRPSTVVNGRSRWELAVCLQWVEIAALRYFWEQRKGPLEAFYIYDPWETSPLFSYDETGVATTGRHTVRFDGEWPQFSVFGFTEVNFGLVELA